MKKNEYDVIVVKVIDGDTVDVDIDLGFGIWLRNQRVRIYGIDTPESRTSDDVEKLFGLAAKKRVEELLQNNVVLITTDDKHGEDSRGKFGRILGDFSTNYGLLTDILIEEGFCVKYFGGSKEDIKQQHLMNRKKLLDNGYVNKLDYDKLIP